MFLEGHVYWIGVSSTYRERDNGHNITKWQFGTKEQVLKPVNDGPGEQCPMDDLDPTRLPLALDPMAVSPITFAIKLGDAP